MSIYVRKYCEEELSYAGKQIVCMFFLVFRTPITMTQGSMVMGYDHPFIATRKMRRQQDSSSSHCLFMSINLTQVQKAVYQTSILTVTNKAMHHKH